MTRAHVTEALKLAEARGALVVAKGPGSKRLLDAWRKRCFDNGTPHIAARLRKREADIWASTEPTGKVLSEAAEKAVTAALNRNCGFGLFGTNGGYAEVPLAEAEALVGHLVALFAAPGAVVPWEQR